VGVATFGTLYLNLAGRLPQEATGGFRLVSAHAAAVTCAVLAVGAVAGGIPTVPRARAPPPPRPARPPPPPRVPSSTESVEKGSEQNHWIMLMTHPLTLRLAGAGGSRSPDTSGTMDVCLTVATCDDSSLSFETNE